jgi:hypothetical protein
MDTEARKILDGILESAGALSLREPERTSARLKEAFFYPPVELDPVCVALLKGVPLRLLALDDTEGAGRGQADALAQRTGMDAHVALTAVGIWADLLRPRREEWRRALGLEDFGFSDLLPDLEAKLKNGVTGAEIVARLVAEGVPEAVARDLAETAKGTAARTVVSEMAARRYRRPKVLWSGGALVILGGVLLTGPLGFLGGIVLVAGAGLLAYGLTLE